MSALYIMRFRDVPDSAGIGALLGRIEGHGVLFIGRGIVLGIDVAGIRYSGTSTQTEKHLELRGIITDPVGGVLVTGDVLGQGETRPVAARLPVNFDDGSFYPVSVGGLPVQVAFEKIGDIP